MQVDLSLHTEVSYAKMSIDDSTEKKKPVRIITQAELEKHNTEKDAWVRL